MNSELANPQVQHLKSFQLEKFIHTPLPTPKREKSHYLKADKVGRNEKCPCGSGLKFKHCCWKKTLQMVSNA